MDLIKFNYKKTSLLEERLISDTADSLNSYIEKLIKISEINDYSSEEASINLVSDDKLRLDIKKIIKEKNNDNLKYIIVVGIGGSNLGTMAIYESIFGRLHLALSDNKPKIIFLDTNNPKLISDIEKILEGINSSEEIILNVISKSGGTTETIVNFETLYFYLNSKVENIDKRIVVTTDLNSKFQLLAEKNDFSILNIPKKVGGRYSVFSAVSLFPLALTGINIDNLLDGALSMRNECLKADIEKNPALISSVIMFLYSKKGVNISNSFFFQSQFEMVGKWYRQLMGESIGKEKNKNGDVVNFGITPIISIGSTDLHSMAQLFLGGPKDKFTTFINTNSEDNSIFVPESLVLDGLVNGISGKKYSDIMSAIYNGVLKAYENNNVPYMEIVLPNLTENSIGQFLQFKMMEMMFLAELLGLNAFDQPNVEDYKIETKKLLEK